jgi:hypothetical protein
VVSNDWKKIFRTLRVKVVNWDNEEKPVGRYEVEFSAEGGATDLASGIYFYKIQAGNFVEANKMIFLKKRQMSPRKQLNL